MQPNEPRPMKSSEWVQADLRRRIESGELSPGDKLPSVVELSAAYNVGRSTVREALSALKAMGLVSIRQGGGTFASAPERPPHPAATNPGLWTDRAHTLKKILEVRRVLESGCAALAARNRRDEDVAALSALLDAMAERLDDGAFSEQADVRFHLAVAAATGNPMLLDMMQSLSERLHDSMRDTRALWFYAETSSAERLLREHRAIFEAIASGDADEARQRMDNHLAKVEQVLNERA